MFSLLVGYCLYRTTLLDPSSLLEIRSLARILRRSEVAAITRHGLNSAPGFMCRGSGQRSAGDGLCDLCCDLT